MPAIGDVYKGRWTTDLWEIKEVLSGLAPFKMQRLYDNLEITVGHRQLTACFALITPPVKVPEAPQRRLLEFWSGGIDGTVLPKIKGHVCTYVKYDTGLPNSRVFEYCKVCDKEKE